MVVEAFLAAAIFLAAASYVTVAMQNGPPPSTEAVALATADALDAVLSLKDARGEPVLDAAIRDAWRCAEDATSPACASAAGAALRSRLNAYLPTGAGHSLEIVDGPARLPLAMAGATTGPSEGASTSYAPQWRYGLAAPRVACAGLAGGDRVDAVFLRDGNAGLARGVTTEPSTSVTRASDVWSATFAPAPASGVAFRARVLGEEVAAQAQVPPCALAAQADALASALGSAAFTITTPDERGVFAGGAVEIRHDLTTASEVDGVALESVGFDLYAPSDGSAPLWSVELPAAPAGALEWRVPQTALHGCYPTALRASWLVTDGTTSEAIGSTLLGVVCVVPPSGHVPAEPAYRLSLRAWMHDWGG